MQTAELSHAELLVLKAHFQNNPAVWGVSDFDVEMPEIIAHYQQIASPTQLIWREGVTRQEIYNDTSSTGTDWNWTTYKGQGVAEQNAWVQMFMGDEANFTKPNLRAGIGNIFGGANNNTLHALAIGQRPATVFEVIFSTNTTIAVCAHYGKTLDENLITTAVNTI